MCIDELKQQILTHAKQTEPHECCGFVVSCDGQLHYLACENVAVQPIDYFEIDPNEYLKAHLMGDIVALVHSHPNGKPVLSLADIQMQEQSQLDWWLVCNDEIHQFPLIPNLLGREFEHEKMDCYTLLRDFYRLAGVNFPDFVREEEWWVKGKNLYLDNMALYFEPIETYSLQVGDVILVQVGANVPNHAAVYIGEQMILHHSPKRLSKRDLYDGYWLKHTHSIWRLKQWQQSPCDFTVALNNLAINLN